MAIDGALKLNVQVMRGKEPAIGPGKAMVMDAIDRHGSISAAGRALGMSYRRTWLLANALNIHWREQVLETTVGGGRQSGGARLTPFGHELLARYRAVEAAMMAAGETADRDWLTAGLRDV